MKQFFSRFIIEILILLVGTVTGLIQAIFVRDLNLAILIVIVSLFASLSTLAIKNELTNQISEQFQLTRLVRQLSDEHWRTEAEELLNNFTEDLARWVRGNRIISLGESVPYQINLLRRTTKNISAIHVGIPKENIYQWDKTTGPFSMLIEAHRKLDSKVAKRRIFVCDESLLQGNVVCDDRIKAIFEDQIKTPDTNGLGVELRILRQSTLIKTNTPVPPDLLIVDKRETVIIRGVGGNYIEVEAIINAAQVKSYIKLFESYWETAEPIEKYLVSV